MIDINEKEYAKVYWTARDIQILNSEISIEKAETILEEIEKQLKASMIEKGWQVLQDRLDEMEY